MNKIKIVFIHWAFYMGGTQRQFIELVRGMDRNRFDPRVVAFRDSAGTLRTILDTFNIPVTCLKFPKLKSKFHPASSIKFYRLMRDMVRYLKQERPQIAQTYLPWINICGSFAAKLAGVPVIITGRRANINEKYMDFPKFPDQWLQDLSNLWTTAVITNSYAVKKECLQREKYLTERKIQVIYNGIDIDRYAVTTDIATPKMALRIPENSPVVGIIASLHPRKGHRDFLQAAEIVLRSCPQTVFLIAGQDVGIQRELENFTTQLGIRDSIRFTGQRDDISELLAVLDVQVSSSYIEGLSNAILEGMAAGKPIVATNVAGNPELVVHEQTGILVPIGDPNRLAKAIIRLLRNRALREKFGNAGRHRVASSFRMDQMIHQTEAFYESLVIDKQ